MPRTIKNPLLRNRTQRAKVAPRPDPYWHLLSEGKHLGYRKTGERQGTWIARHYDKETKKRRWEALGNADDTVEANGTSVLSFGEASESADLWFKKLTEADSAGVTLRKYSVADAARDWLSRWSGTERGLHTATVNVEAHILPKLGSIQMHKLNRATIERWLHDQAAKPPLKVTARQQSNKKLSPSRQSKVNFDPSDPETIRKRKDSANRVFRDLRALLNRAVKNQHATNPERWNGIDELKNAAQAKSNYLSLDEAQRFIAGCPKDFAELVQGALITGCRYGELCALKASAYNRDLGALAVTQSKTGKLKHIFLTPDETAFFDKATDGKQSDESIFLRADGLPWGKSHQQDRMESSLKAAGIDRHVRFHDLRHTFASLLAMNGTSMQLIANQLGHSGTRMAEKHYAHFSPAYVATTIRANKPSYGQA